MRSVVFVVGLLMLGNVDRVEAGKPFTTLEMSYVDDLYKMNYVSMMNFHCKYMNNDAGVNILNMINDTVAMLGADRMRAYNHGEGAKRFAEQKRLFASMNDLDFKPEAKKRACTAHKAEVLALYRKLMASTNDSGEAEDR